jgi:HlyD family secretion protein
MRIRVLIVSAIIIALAGGIMAIRTRGSASSAPSAPPQPAPVPVTVATASRADFVTSVSATGTVASLREAKIASKLSGIVAEVFVREGQRVQAGTPLLRLRTSDLVASAAQARAGADNARARLMQLQNGARPEERLQAAAAVAQAEAAVQSAQANLLAKERGARPQEREQAANLVAQAKAALDLAQADVQRMRSLFQMGAISKQQLDAAETQFRQAQAAYDSTRQQQALVNEGPRVEELMTARAQLRQAQAALESARQSLRLVEIGARPEEIAAARAQLAQAEAVLAATQVQLRDATVAAPFAGTITQRSVEPGEATSPATPAFVLAQLDDVFAELAVPERQRPGLRVGQAVSVTVDALPGSPFAGKIEEVQPGATVSSRSFAVKVRVPNSQGVLRPGMFARGTITVAVRPNVLQVPDSAVLTTVGKPIVFIVQGGKAVRHEVTLGERQDGMVEITSGLAGGEQVVASGAAALTDDQPVACNAPRIVACR